MSLTSFQLAGQTGRLESEYKLDVPQAEVSKLWNHLKESYSTYTLGDGTSLTGTQSIETFIDAYYDSPDFSFAEKEISLRHRKRIKDGQLIKELIQFKTPYSTDKVIRNEIKYEVNNKKALSNLTRRHDFLKHLSISDTEAIAFHLAKYRLRPEDIVKSLKLNQNRRRIYLSDNNNESIATLTLDQVRHSNFPFQSYAELELELNELRYTNATLPERQLMEALNNEIKSNLSQTFPSLAIDQRSKYHKMQLLVRNNPLAFLYDNLVWLVFGVVTFIASILFIKDQLN